MQQKLSGEWIWAGVLVSWHLKTLYFMLYYTNILMCWGSKHSMDISFEIEFEFTVVKVLPSFELRTCIVLMFSDICECLLTNAQLFSLRRMHVECLDKCCTAISLQQFEPCTIVITSLMPVPKTTFQAPWVYADEDSISARYVILRYRCKVLVRILSSF